MYFYLQTLMSYSNFHNKKCVCVCECVSVLLSILQNCIMQGIILSLFGITSEMVTLTEMGCHGMNAATESRGDKLYSMFGQAARKNCREEYTNKK